MSDLPKFKLNNPSNKEEELIREFIELLDKTTKEFIIKNNPGNITPQTFVVLRDASIGYAGAMVRDLAKLLQYKSERKRFIIEGKKIFNAYLENVEKDLEMNNGN